MSFGFTPGETVVVTGAGSGIGRAAAAMAAAMGCQVALWDRDADAVGSAAAELVAGGARASATSVDVTVPGQVVAAVETARATHGPLRYLLNNAGPSSAVPMDFDAALVAAVGSVRLVTDVWAAAPDRPEGAAMVVTSSVAGNRVGTESDWYSAAKAALAGYVRHLAAHRSAEFRSNAVAPGMTDTPRLATFRDSAQGAASLSRIPLARMGTPAEVAAVLLFLVSPCSSYVNGAVLPVDGGWTVTQ
ncbi:SDR family oxidoreductase [Nocardioides sp. zg-ZUI104]|uniref:SDR family NAD(P)-dependent oxidoreductase n=1 Tax=Nocardioides faecalis TaxID=2803858 RepID=UPI001BCDA5BB|nr:SDR family oxidoreductase [Nocardioides faecalis]MBS4751947.1 SDR family oxidoreductase [Nocardioides faecalis]